MPIGVNGIVSKGNDSDVHVTYYNDDGMIRAFFCEFCNICPDNNDANSFESAEEVINHLIAHMMNGDKVPIKIITDLVDFAREKSTIVTHRDAVLRAFPDYFPQTFENVQ